MSRIAKGAAVAVVALMCAACAPTLVGGSGSQPDASGSAQPTPSHSESPSASAPTPSADASAGSCPVGEWILDNDSWDTALTAVWSQAVSDSEVSVTGQLWLDWVADGTYLLTAQGSTYVASGTVDGTDFVQTIVHNGTESGTWSHTGGDTYQLVATDSTSWDSSVTMEAGGSSYAVDQSSLPADPWSGTLTVTCGAGRMTNTVTEDAATIAVDFLNRSR